MATSARITRDGPLAVQIEEDGSSLIARVFGELDIGTAEFLDEELRRAWDRDVSTIVLDLDAVGFIDSRGLQVLIAAAKRSRDNGNRLCIRRGSEVVDRVIQLTGVEDHLPLVDR